MEGVKAFFDTNILVYSLSSSDERKQKMSLGLLKGSSRVISTQVLKELSNFLISKTDFELGFIYEKIKSLASVMEIVEESSNLVLSAFNIHNVYKFSFYDCLIISAALSSGCKILYTEDLQDGQILFGSLKIINPFTENFSDKPEGKLLL